MSKVKVGLIGSQFGATLHIEAFAKVPDAEVVAAASPTRAHVDEFTRQHGIPDAYTDYHQLLERPDIELVCIAVPNYLHCTMVEEAAAAGKHIVIEKPLAMNLEEADRMIAACRKAGMLLLYAECLCFAPKYVRAKRLVDEGGIGRPYWIRQYEKHWGPHSDWFWDVDRSGGGALFDMGCHGFEFARWVFGKPKVKSVTATCGTYVHTARTRADDYAVFLVEFEGDGTGRGPTAQVEDSWSKPGGIEDCAEIYGTEGVVYCDIVLGSAMQVYSRTGFGYAVEKAETTKGWSHTIFEENWQYGYPQEMQHFIECVQGKTQPIETAEDGRLVLEVMFAAYESAATGRRIDFPYRPAFPSRPIESWLQSKK
jgi:myo-inositol 2-dehydrogenase / D-chiro-inositol 1-dehydrogenase